MVVYAYTCKECRRIERFPVPYCDGCGRTGGAYPIDVTSIATLANNLAIGAGLSRAYWLGYDAEGCAPTHWMAGCGKEAP